MANFNVIPFALLGRQISFVDQSVAQNLPADFPEELKNPVITGVVEFIDISFNVKMEMSCDIVVDGSNYCISEIDLIVSK
jgi:hypothetical protein